MPNSQKTVSRHSQYSRLRYNSFYHIKLLAYITVAKKSYCIYNYLAQLRHNVKRTVYLNDDKLSA